MNYTQIFKKFRMTIAAKIFFGFVGAILFMMLSNFFLLRSMMNMRETVERTGESVAHVSKERHILDRAGELKRTFLAYAAATESKAKDSATEEYISEAPDKIFGKIVQIRQLVDSLALPKDTTARIIIASLDTMEFSAQNMRKDLFIRAIEAFMLSMEKVIVVEQVRTSEYIVESSAITRKSWRLGIVVVVIIFIISALIALIIAKFISKPISHLREATRYARTGKYNLRVPVVTNDEVADLTIDFNEMLSALNKLEKMKSMFLSSITHDLKSPLYRVRLGLENMQDNIYGTLSPEQNAALTQILADTDTLSRLIYDILDIQKMEGGKFELTLAQVELDKFVRDAVTRHAISFSSKGVGLSLRIRAIDGRPAVLDVRQIERVFENLLSNALKFTPSGGKVVVSAEVTASFVVFQIMDTGPGIPADEVDKVFDKFFRASTGKSASGTGLGLSIARFIIEAHQGKIWVTSVLGTGTTFFVQLPLDLKPSAR